MTVRRTVRAAAAGMLAAGLALGAGITAGLSGCEREEPVFQMDTPGVDIEVNKTGEESTEVEIQTGKDAQDESSIP